MLAKKIHKQVNKQPFSPKIRFFFNQMSPEKRSALDFWFLMWDAIEALQKPGTNLPSVFMPKSEVVCFWWLTTSLILVNIAWFLNKS